MKDAAPGIRQFKAKIEINAPVEVCYQTWTNMAAFPEMMRKILDVQEELPNTTVSASKEEVQSTTPNLTNHRVTPEVVRHWLISGPGGKLYKIENKVSVDIPNHFYATMSTDPDDLSTQASVLFMASPDNQTTLLEFQASFWESGSIENGKSTQLDIDIINDGKATILDCLEDFKRYVETGGYPEINGKAHQPPEPTQPLSEA